MTGTPTLMFLGAGVLLCILLAAGSALTSRGYVFASGRIQGVIGIMGSGKSLFVVQKVVLPAAKCMAKRRGLYCSHTYRPVKRIITNFTMDLPYDVELIVLDGNRVWDHLLELAGDWSDDNGNLRLDALVIIDEAHLYVPSAKLKVGQKAGYVLSMARKMNAEVWWITQNEMKIHKRVRDDTQYIWRVGRSGSVWTIIAGPSKWFKAMAFQPEKLRGMNVKPLDQRWYRLSKKALSAYNSFDLIVPDADIDVSLDELSARRQQNTPPVLSPNMATGTTFQAFPAPVIPVELDGNASTF